MKMQWVIKGKGNIGSQYTNVEEKKPRKNDITQIKGGSGGGGEPPPPPPTLGKFSLFWPQNVIFFTQ